MKKLLFAAHSLNLGGIEKALVTLTNILSKKGYKITIVLEKKEGIFLKELDPKIEIIEYKTNYDKNIFIRKIRNLCKRIKFIIKNKNKFDFSASFATYSIPSSFIARMASHNCYLWGHADYLTLFKNNKQEMEQFFKERKYNKFKKIIFVSKEGRENFIKVFPNMKEKTIVCNNLIDANKIETQSKEKINYKKTEGVTLFVNVGRHDEKQKKLSRIIEVGEKLKKENYKFQILLIGDGPETDEYKKNVKEKNLEKEIVFLGRKQNPYPYFKIADCTILTSDYEGYPVVFLESFILNRPIITTKVSDYEQIDGKYGYVTEKNVEDIYEKMKKFIENGFTIKEKFDSLKYNNEIIKKIESLF